MTYPYTAEPVGVCSCHACTCPGCAVCDPPEAEPGLVRCFSCAEPYDPGDGCGHLDLCADCAGDCRLCADDRRSDPWREPEERP